MSATSVHQHNVEIERNREAWSRKPRLRAAYQAFYRAIASRVDRSINGAIVEVGSGIGAIKEVIPDCITTDLFPNPWLDRQENAYRLSFGSHGVSNLILFDVWHHLRFPGTALLEFERVLAPGGRLILFEPAVSWVGRVIYGPCHHEPLGLHQPITWHAPQVFAPGDVDYYAAQASASRVFWWRESNAELSAWRVREVTPIVSFAYLSTGGFSTKERGGSLIQRLTPVLDRVTARWPRIFAARLLIVLEKAH